MCVLFQRGPYRLDSQFSVEFTFAKAQITCEWSPRMPVGRKGRRLLPAYQAARGRFLRELADGLGFSVLCVDLPMSGGAA
jgi:hypothetical protein